MKKTLLILGAGASKDFCRIFPTGLELIKEINYHFLTEKKVPVTSLENGCYLSALMNDIVRVFGNNADLFRLIKNQLWQTQLDYEWNTLRNNFGDPVSIDSFISNQIRSGKLQVQAIPIIKYAIYYLIKGYEQAYAETKYGLARNWIDFLVDKLSHESFSSIKENLKIVTFNYDRSFEHYFIIALQRFFSLSEDQKNEIEENVIHAYGSLGRLNEIWFNSSNDQPSIFKDKYQEIHLINERQTHLRIIDAEKFRQVSFLGFGFDSSNMDLINVDQFKSATFSGTAYGFSELEIKQLRERRNVVVYNCTCSDYIQSIDF